MKHALTDVHQHLLWGLDDGAASPEIMYSMLDEAHRQGIGRIFATCHIRPGFEPFDAGLYRDRLAQARDYCRLHELAVQVLPGAEAAWTYQTVSALRRGAVPALGGTDCVLLEFWPDVSFQEARQAVRSLAGAGYRPMLAHVERYRCFTWFPKRAVRFREETGALFQMNAGTLLRPRGPVEKRLSDVLLRERALDAVATDAHGCDARPVNLRRAHDLLVQRTDAEYARTLTTFPGEPV